MPNRRPGGVPHSAWSRFTVVAAVCAVVLAPAGVPVGAASAGGIPGHAATTTDAPALLGTPVLSARRAPGLLGQQVAEQRLGGQLAAIAAAAPPDSCITVASGGRTLFTHNPDLPLVPASTLKIATAAVALEVFGPDHRFTTQVRTSVPPTPPADDGAGAEVDGDLYLVGGGDPLLATQGYAVSRFGGSERVVSGFEAVADAIAATGVRRITGDVVGDGSRHDGATGVDTWDPSYLNGNTIGSLGALRVNSGLTGWDADPALPGMRGRPGDPALEAARIMVTLLTERGVTVDGGPSTGIAPREALLLTEVASPPMRTVADEVLAWSNNGASELLVKELGLAVEGEASTAVGTAVVLDQLAAWDLPTAGVVLVDGSGLDTTNLLTCSALVSLLDHLGAGSVAGESLAVGASWGTLRLRFSEAPGADRVRAKTGTLNPVVALAGFTNSLPDDTEYTFAVVLNGIPGDPALSPEAVDLVAVVLTGHEATVDTSAFGPVTSTPDP